MTAPSKRPSVKNKAQQKRPFCKQVLAAPVRAQWPAIPEAQVQLIKQAVKDAADGLGDRKRMQPPWRELRKVPKDKRAEAIKKFKEEHLDSLDLPEREAFLQAEQAKNEKLSEIVFGYNEVMRHLSKGSLACVLVNKSATPEFLAKSFLPGCYCRGIPVAAIDNLQEVLGKCIGVGFRESVKEEGSAFHALYTLLKDASENSTQKPELSSTSACSQNSDAESLSTKKNSKLSKKIKVPPPVVDASRFHLIRGSKEQNAFFCELSGKQWSSDVISLSTDIPDTRKTSMSFDFRKKKPIAKTIQEDSSLALGEGEVKESRKPASTINFKKDVLFELDYGIDNQTEDDKTPKGSSDNSFNGQSSAVQRSNVAAGTRNDGQKTENRKRKVKELEEKLTGATSYVPAAVMRVVGNPKRKKRKGQ